MKEAETKVDSDPLYHGAIIQKKKLPWPLVRKRNIPNERPLLVGEVNANFCE
jgi:hypothetical protein